MTDLDIAYQLHSEVVTFWQFYVAGMTGVVGWVFARNSSWPFAKRIGVIGCVVVFMIFNISGLYRTTSALHDAVLIMFAEGYSTPQGITASIFQVVLTRLNTGDWYMHIGPHLLVDVIIIYFVFFVSGREPSDIKSNKKNMKKRASS